MSDYAFIQDVQLGILSIPGVYLRTDMIEENKQIKAGIALLVSNPTLWPLHYFILVIVFCDYPPSYK